VELFSSKQLKDSPGDIFRAIFNGEEVLFRVSIKWSPFSPKALIHIEFCEIDEFQNDVDYTMH
jgi:hypothetical protein